MTGIERRSQERIRVRFPCEVELQGRRGSGTVRDLSAGGLSVQTDMPVQEGDELQLRLQPKGRPALEIQALVWHLHGTRNRSSGECSTRLGLALSKPADAFLDLLRAYQPAPSQTPVAPPPPGSPVRPARKTEQRERQHRVRVKQSATSRTRPIVVFARSDSEAKTTALEETGSGWAVLDVTPWGSRSERP